MDAPVPPHAATEQPPWRVWAAGVAVSFSQGGEVRALLHALAQNPTPPPPAIAQRLRQLDARLDIGVRELGLGLIAVADREGVVVASGEPPGIRSFVGNRYRDGPLYAATREGQSARMFMVGETTGRRSVVFAEPVMVDGRFVGYVGVSITLDEGVLPAEADNAIVSDAHGVVVLSRERRWLFRRLVHVPTWPPPPAEGWPIYGGQPPRLWPWQPGATGFAGPTAPTSFAHQLIEPLRLEVLGLRGIRRHAVAALCARQLLDGLPQ
ncbi:Cache domain protein [Tepidimonas fonticaldi]|uniref:Cache domain protein n=1 Tax=Tepidimonas fonticaldi TaxID=1101373 RepID=A0A554XN66_9BURK|nr:hypothetical protein [Tepidimonas fonticaldi]TSE37259.1 Cache domain protein [Tepidimonas fonticaldi]